MHNAIIITVPKTIKWLDYQRELGRVKNWEKVMSFRVANLPKVSIGARCYVVHNGIVRGWMKIVEFGQGGFKCETTGKLWPPGKYIVRSGPFHYLEKRYPLRGFRGFRYVNQEDYEG